MRSAPGFRGGFGSALVAVAAAAGLLVALRAVVELDLDGVTALLRVETTPREAFGISWSDRARWPADAQLAAWSSLVRTVATLFLACVAVATLNAVVLLAEASSSRRPELAVRAALGADRRALALRLLAELRTLVLTGLGAGLVAGLAGGTAARLAWPQRLEPVLGNAPIELLIAALVLVVVLAAAHLAGVRQAGRAGRMAADLRAGARVSADPLAVFVRKAMAAGHVAVAGTVLAAAATLAIPAADAPAEDSAVSETVVLEGTAPATPVVPLPTTPAAPVVAVPTTPAEPAVPPAEPAATARADPTRASRADAWADALAVLRAVPGLEAESLAAPGALLGLGVRDIAIAECGRCVRGGLPAPLWNALADHHVVAPGYFELAGLEVAEGRGFTAVDVAGAEPVAIVNRTFARTSFELGRPIGKRIRIGTDFDAWYTVVGIVEDEPLPTLGADGVQREAVYLSALQRPPASATILLRGSEEAVRAGRAAMEAAGYGLGAPESLVAYRARHAGAVAWSRAVATALGALVVLLALHGIWTVALQTTRRRWGDLALRRAVGAPSRRIVGWVLGERLRVTGWGLAGFTFFGTLAVAFLQAATGLGGPPVRGYVAIAVALATVSVVASVQSAREALRVEPVRLLE